MLPAVTVPTAQAVPPTVTAPAAVPTTPVSAAANVVFNAVPANTSSVALFNNIRGDSGGIRQPGGGSSASSSGSTSSNTAASRFPSLGFSSLFVAQAISQDNNNGLYARITYPQPQSLTPDQQMLERFALTKYLPSNAARPLPQPTGTANIEPPVPQATSENVPRPPVQDNPIIVRQPAMAPELPQSTANTMPIVSTAQASTDNTTRTNRLDSPFTSRFMMGRGESSLVRQDGVNAYLATFSRNMAQLNPKTNPPVSVTL